MKNISVFDIFKIGVGPSSSHTLAPWRSSLDVINRVNIDEVEKIEIILFGSLSKTGIGHGTNLAVLMGLLGLDYKTIDTSKFDEILKEIKSSKKITVSNRRQLDFDFEKDIKFDNNTKREHPNTLDYIFYINGEKKIFTYYSVGGGFIQKKEDSNQDTEEYPFKYEINNAKDVEYFCKKDNISIRDLSLINELTVKEEKNIYNDLLEISKVMEDSILNGANKHGILMGGLGVSRRGSSIIEKITHNSQFSSFEDLKSKINHSFRYNEDLFSKKMLFISAFALCVGEENASFSRVVTAPTNGASGVIPSVIAFLKIFHNIDDNQIIDFFLVSGLIGALFKKNGTISGAVGGCQAEIGVSSAMASAGMTYVLGGSLGQVLSSAEIAMEHHLGLTCDPVHGLVQIPCIERNSFGALKAISSSFLALETNENILKVSLDSVIRTMLEISNDMDPKYKETSEGGLAIFVSEC